jgi:hypothetical protein
MSSRKEPFFCFSDCNKIENLIKENPRDSRLANWLITLGKLYLSESPRFEQKAKEHFLRVAELGLGEGFICIAEIYMKTSKLGGSASILP